MATQAKEIAAPQDPIRQLYVEAGNSAKRDRRSEVRFSFFHPVTIQLSEGHRFAAFSRDISATAIGLMHDRELPLGEVDLSISSRNGYSVKVRARITRCTSCGAGWYISAGDFVGLPAVDA